MRLAPAEYRHWLARRSVVSLSATRHAIIARMQQLSLWSAAPAGGLVVHRASRTEHLAPRLALELERNAPASVLEPRRVLVSHDGLRRWQMGQFAQVRVRDTHGIAANIEMILPWQRL